MPDPSRVSKKKSSHKSLIVTTGQGRQPTKATEYQGDLHFPSALQHLNPQTVMQLQRTYGNHQTAQILREHYNQQPTPTVQRMIMTDKQFEESLSGTSFRRSAKMLAIQQALMVYNKASNAPIDERLNKLDDILQAVKAWKSAKSTSDKGKKGKTPSNKKAVEKLEDKTIAEQTELKKKQGEKPDLTKADGVRKSLSNLFETAAKETRAVLAIEAGVIDSGLVKRLAGRETEASHIKKAVKMNSQTAEGANTLLLVDMVAKAINILNLIAKAYLERNAAYLKQAENQNIRFFTMVVNLQPGTDIDHGNKKIFSDEHQKMDERIANFMSIAKARVKGSKAKDVDTDLLDSSLELIGGGTDYSGLFGTGGASNSGYLRAGFDTDMSDNQKNALSGGSDIANHLAGQAADTIALMKALYVLKDENASKEDRRNAKLTIAKYPVQTVQHVSATIGGALTAAKQDGTTLPQSNFGFNPSAGSGTDISTDEKLFGDFAGWFTSMIDAIRDAVSFVHYLDGTERDIKDDMSSPRKVVERIGNVTSKAAGIGASLLKAYKSAVEIGMQIKDAGQTTADAVNSLAPKEMIPIVGIVTGSLGAIQNGYKLWRIGVRRGKLTKKIASATVASELDDIQAIEFAHGSLVKRTVRLGKNLAHSITSIVSSALTLGGITASATLAIGVAQLAEKLGAVAFRKAKQYSRDKKAEKRALKDEERGKTETYQEWKMRKRLDAAQNGRGSQFVTELDVFFTRNWDKSTIEKKKNTRDAALHILDMDDVTIYKALGIEKAIEKAKADNLSYQQKLDIVIAALKKRD